MILETLQYHLKWIYCDLPPDPIPGRFDVLFGALFGDTIKGRRRIATIEEDGLEDDARQPSSHFLKANETDSIHGPMDISARRCASGRLLLCLV